jgi:4,5-dihydroxyphthalate decarboxylase
MRHPLGAPAAGVAAESRRGEQAQMPGTLALRTVTRTQGNNRALKSGAVTPAGYQLEFEEVPVLVDAFRRMVRATEFDVCEMAITTYLCAKAHGKPFTALPIFLVRGLHHGAILKTAKGPVLHPKDLEGRRVGVNRGYTVTTGVWARSILQDEYGVDLDSITWVRSGDEHVAEYRHPANVVPLEPAQDLEDLLETGELAACIGLVPDRPGFDSLIPDAADSALRALQFRQFYPINHLVVVRDDIVNEHPDVGPALFEAFAEAKRRYLYRLGADAIPAPDPIDRMHKRVMDVTGADPIPYGIEPNRAVLEHLIRHVVTQRILEAPPPIDSLFVPSTVGLVA